MSKCKACQCAEEINQHKYTDTDAGGIAKAIGRMMAAHLEGWHCTCDGTLTCDLKDGEFKNGRRE